MHFNNPVEKVCLANALVKINEKRVFLKTLNNPSVIPKTTTFQNLDLHPTQNYFWNSGNDIHDKFNLNGINKTEKIDNQLRLDHLNDGEKQIITEFCYLALPKLSTLLVLLMPNQ